jgi:hypothetical protein
MRAVILIAGLLSILPFCAFQCDPPKTRPIAGVVGHAHSEKPDNKKIESLFYTVADMLRSAGFTGGQHEQPTAYHITGGRIYGEGFSRSPSFGCTIEVDRKSVTVEFYEWETPRHSGIFPASEEQRESVRALAKQIESYLRDRLPKTYDVVVSFHQASR